MDRRKFLKILGLVPAIAVLPKAVQQVPVEPVLPVVYSVPENFEWLLFGDPGSDEAVVEKVHKSLLGELVASSKPVMMSGSW